MRQVQGPAMNQAGRRGRVFCFSPTNRSLLAAYSSFHHRPPQQTWGWASSWRTIAAGGGAALCLAYYAREQPSFRSALAQSRPPTAKQAVPPSAETVPEKGAVWLWGASGVQLSEDTADILSPTLVKALQGKNIKQVSFGEEVAAAVGNNGELYVWQKGEKDVSLIKTIKNVVEVRCGGGTPVEYNAPVGVDVKLESVRIKPHERRNPIKSHFVVVLADNGNKVFVWDSRKAKAGNRQNKGDTSRLAYSNFQEIDLKRSLSNYRGGGGSWFWPFGSRGSSEWRKGSGENIKQVACGMDHIALLSSEGKLYVMGNNSFGQCGIDDFVRKQFYEQPVLVTGALEGKNVVQVACGDYHTVALTSDGCVFYFGNDRYSLINGRGSVIIPSPVLVRELSPSVDQTIKVSRICAAGEHTLALSEKGDLYAWGNGRYAQIPADGHWRHVNLPRRIKSAPFASLTVADSERLMNYKKLTEERKGAAGDIVGFGVRQLECGKKHCAALMVNGDIWTWGDNQRVSSFCFSFSPSFYSFLFFFFLFVWGLTEDECRVNVELEIKWCKQSRYWLSRCNQERAGLAPSPAPLTTQ
ncbi:putative E3 ubiquitin-protein ligase herc4 [Balamuthia mandrillaris]